MKDYRECVTAHGRRLHWTRITDSDWTLCGHYIFKIMDERPGRISIWLRAVQRMLACRRCRKALCESAEG